MYKINNAAANWFRKMNGREIVAKMNDTAGHVALNGTRPGGELIAEAMFVVVLERCGTFGYEPDDTDDRCKWYRSEVLPKAWKLRAMYY